MGGQLEELIFSWNHAPFNKVAHFLEVANPMEFLSNDPNPNEKYDVVCLQNVIEHVRDPETLIALAEKYLALDGCIFVQVPNDFSEVQAFCLEQNFVGNEYWIAPPQHLNYFSKDLASGIS